MTIVAKYAGKCAFCGRGISRGDRIDYEGGKAYHMSCSVIDTVETIEQDGHRYTITKSHDRHGSYTVELVVFNLAGEEFAYDQTSLTATVRLAKFRNVEKQDGLNATDATEVFGNCLAYVRANWPKVEI